LDEADSMTTAAQQGELSNNDIYAIDCSWEREFDCWCDTNVVVVVDDDDDKINNDKDDIDSDD
jgi:hypothetical protein